MSEGIQPSIRMLLVSALGRGRTGITHEEADQIRQAKMMNEEARIIELRRMAGSIGAIRHTRPNIFVGATIPTSHGDISGDGAFPAGTPVGMDEGMVRLAALEAGKSFAKYAGVVGTFFRNPKALVPVGVAAGAYGLHKANKGVQFGLDNLDDALAPTTGFVPEHMKLGGIGGAAGVVGGMASGLVNQAKTFAKNVVGAAKKTGPAGFVAAAATPFMLKGLNKTTHSVGSALEREVKPYTYNRGGFQLPTHANEYGYVTPPPLQY